MIPIWKDITVDLTSYLGGGDYVTYTANIGATLIYTGKAYKTPDGNCKVRINDILADSLSNGLPLSFAADGVSLTSSALAYTVKVGDTTASTNSVMMDYEYGTSHDGSSWARADILGYYDTRMPAIITCHTGETTVSIDGASYTATGTPFNIVNKSGKLGDTLITDGSDNTVTLKRMTTCSRYALYYINALGGWDALLMAAQGNVMTDSYTRHTVGQKYDNTASRNAGTVNIGNEVARTWKLRTPNMSDSQAALMHHLLGSTSVYLFDMVSSQWYPVTITDNSCVYKTYRNQGMKRVSYDINVTIAHDMIRR